MGIDLSMMSNREAERSVIGSALIGKDEALDEAAGLAPEMFYDARNRDIWAAMIAMRERRAGMDELTLAAMLPGYDGISTYLGECQISVPTWVHIGTYADIVRRMYQLREIVLSGSQIVAAAVEASKSPDAAVDLNAPLAKIDSAIAQTTAGDIISAAELSQFTFSHIERIAEGSGTDGIFSTGLTDLDYLLGGGVFRGSFDIWAGPPGVGKSILAYQILWWQALNRKRPGVIFSLEMGRLQVAARYLAVQTGVPQKVVRYGPIPDEQRSGLVTATDSMYDVPWYLSTKTHWTTHTLRAAIRRLKREKGVELVVVDMINLLKDQAPTENMLHALIGRNLHDIAKDEDVALLGIWGLNKEGATGSASQRKLTDLRGSMELPHAADNVFFVDFQDKKSGWADPATRTITIGKFRDGEPPTQSIELRMIPGRPAMGLVANRPEIDVPPPAETQKRPKSIWDADRGRPLN